jgi:hypothetical protein
MVRPRRRVCGCLALLVIGLSGCGGSSHAPDQTHSKATLTSAPTAGAEPTTVAAVTKSSRHTPSEPRRSTDAGSKSTPTAVAKRAFTPPRAREKANPDLVKRSASRRSGTSPRHTPAACLRFAGLGHVGRAGRDRWQGTIGEKSRRDINGSVFVLGPYRSARAAKAGAATLARREIALVGGKYVATATSQSYLSATVSLAAACLSAGSGHPFSF